MSNDNKPGTTMIDTLEACPDRPQRLKEVEQFAREVFQEAAYLTARMGDNPLLPLAAANLKDPYPDAQLELLTRLVPEVWTFDERARFRVVRGMLIGAQHLWFVVEVPGSDVGDVVPWWRYIIDPRMPGARPSVVMIEPGSCMQLAYVEGIPKVATESDDDG